MPTPSRSVPAPGRWPAAANAWRCATLLLLALQGTAGAAAPLEEALLAVAINDQPAAAAAVLLRDPQGRLLASRSDLESWRIQAVDCMPVLQEGIAYCPLDDLPGLRYAVSAASQSIALQVPATLFASTRVAALPPPSPAAPPSARGGFLNYDLHAVQSDESGLQAGALLELGWFGPSGISVGNLLLRESGNKVEAIRLDTTWTRDLPEARASLRLGDTVSFASGWSRAVRLGGLQWASNFATQPDFVSFPLPGINGETALPSTADLYVNGALNLRRELPAGPFQITDLPVLTGQGEVRLVVRDLLGREQVISQPYYASSRLLRAGLEEFSYEAGFVRENFGRDSADYGRAAALATRRYGFSDHFTGEAHLELARRQQTLGVGAAVLWPQVGVFNAALAASTTAQGGNGALLALGFERQGPRFGFGTHAQFASADFRQLGQPDQQPAPRAVVRAYASYASASHGSLSFAYSLQDQREREDVELASLSYGLSLGAWGFLNLSAIRFFGNDPDTLVGLSLTRALGSAGSASLRLDRQAGSSQALLQVQRSAPAGSGLGYRLLAGGGVAQRLEAGISLQHQRGTLDLDAGMAGGRLGLRAAASGGIALLGGSFYASRRISESFAVVDLGGYPDVSIYQDNQEVARSNGTGRALLPRLRAYQRNPVRIEPGDLPLDTSIDALQIDAVPRFRSGLLLAFPIWRSRGGLITVRLDDGQPLPAGATARFVDGTELFPTGESGEIYLTGLAAFNRIELSWRGQHCEITVSFPPTDDPLPHLGSHLCQGVRP